MRSGLLVSAAALACALALHVMAPDARAQAPDCSQAGSPTAQAICSDPELTHLAHVADRWRDAAHQKAEDRDYFAGRRDRCAGDAVCITRELQTEISDLQVASGATLPDEQVASTPTPAPISAAALAGGPAMTRLDQALDQIVTADSSTWLIWRYDRGSMHNARRVSRSNDGRTIVLAGDYTFNGGSPGSVQVQMVGDTVSCIEFWNEGRCRPMGQPPSHAIMAGLVAGMLAGGGSSSGSSSSAANNPDRYDPNDDRQNTYTPPPPPPPDETTTGFYGNCHGGEFYGC